MGNQLELLDILEGCKKKNRHSQKKLYERFFKYGMSISLRYTNSKEDALEVLNDGFLKVFLNLNKYDPAYPFKAWIRKIIIYTSIDHHRANVRRHALIIPLSETVDPQDTTDFSTDLFNDDDLLPIVQRLPLAYRTVFNLYVMDGYKHHEIATLLGISEGTSKSNLSRAKTKLKAWLMQEKKEESPKKIVKDG